MILLEDKNMNGGLQMDIKQFRRSNSIFNQFYTACSYQMLPYSHAIQGI